jgi:hypothetical protein
MSCSSTKLISIRGWHVIVGYKFGYRYQFGLFTDC